MNRPETRNSEAIRIPYSKGQIVEIAKLPQEELYDHKC